MLDSVHLGLAPQTGPEPRQRPATATAVTRRKQGEVFMTRQMTRDYRRNLSLNGSGINP